MSCGGSRGDLWMTIDFGENVGMDLYQQNYRYVKDIKKEEI